jgi:hypothetical protein
VAINRVACPECGAGLKSSTGFTPGQVVSCPKCETEFTVEGAADDAEPAGGYRPREAAAGEREWSYRTSKLRFAVLGVLLVVLGVLGYMLYEKKRNEARDSTDNTSDRRPAPGPEKQPQEQELLPLPPPPVGAGGGGGGRPKGKNGPQARTPTADEARAMLVGTWEGKLNGAAHAVEYKADGTFSYAADKDGTAGKPIAGKWKLEGVNPGPGGAAALNVEWEVEGRPAFRETVLLRAGGTASHPYLDQELEGKKAGGTFTKRK